MDCGGLTIEELEKIFNLRLLVDKSVKTNEKELKPTYGKNDCGQDGYLAYKKLQLDVQDLVSAISERQFLALLDRYESSRHGKISFADFLQFIKDHALQLPHLDKSTNHGNTRLLFDRLGKTDEETEVSSIFNASHPREMEWRLKTFLKNLEAHLVKIALETSRTRQIGLSGSAAEENYKHLSKYTCEQHESIALSTLTKMFAPFAAESIQGDPKNSENCVDFNGFYSVIRSFQFPGCSTVKLEVIDHLFDLCSSRLEKKQGVDVDTPMLSMDGEKLASPALLIKLIFGAPDPLAPPVAVPSPRGSKGKKGKKPKRASLIKSLDAVKGKSLKSNPIWKSMDENRDPIGFGPVRMNGLTRPNILSVKSIKCNTPALAMPVPAAVPETKRSHFDLPLKLSTRKSRTSLPVPTRFDSVVAIQKSNTLPKYELRRKHVFGMSTTLYSGSAIHIISDQTEFEPVVSKNESSDSRNIEKERELFLDSATIAYPSAGLGVIHNLAVNKQTHYNGHIEDVTCMAISADGSLAATGCNGKAPTVHIWATEISDPLTPLLIIGKGFFYRGVCAVEFSFDSQYLIAVGCDDYHMVGVFNLLNGEKLCDATGQKGLPPLIKWIRYCPDPQSTVHISKEHTIPCDLFASAGGERHIKLWSFRRPQRDGTPAALVSKILKMGKTGATVPKAFMCCAFIPSCDGDKVDTEGKASSTYDLVAGGSNGVLYLFEKITCVVFRQAMKGKIQCLEIISGSKAADYRVVIGGLGGVVKVFVARTLSELHSFCLSEAAPPPKLTRSASNRSSTAPRRPESSRRRSLRPEDIGKAITSGPAGDLISGDIEQPSAELRSVTGLAVSNKADAPVYVIVTLGSGKAVRLDVPSSPSAGSIHDINSNGHKVSVDAAMNSLNNLKIFNNSSMAPSSSGTVLFHYHVGSLYGLAVAARRLCATVGDDKQLMLWDVVDCELLAKTTLKNPSRCCHFDKSKSFIAVGCVAGSITLYRAAEDKFREPANLALGRSTSMKLTEVACRTDSKGECTEVKFSPSNDLIAVGTRDDTIYIYSWSPDNVATTDKGFSGTSNAASSSSCTLRLMHKLKGHTATILHIDWSFDSQLIRSVCNAYEIICWDVPVGKVNSTVNPEDVRWKTRHCKLVQALSLSSQPACFYLWDAYLQGFNVMGIWPPYSNGSEVNSVDVCVEKGLVVTANDRAGLTRLFNYPCVVKIAPNKAYSGHSAHVMKCRFLLGGDTVVTVGGRDASLQVWDCVP